MKRAGAALVLMLFTTAVPLASAQHAILWTQTGMQDLGTLPRAVGCSATAINNAGTILGSCFGPSSSVHPFRWTPKTGMTSLHIGSAVASGFNDQGEVIGSYGKDVCNVNESYGVGRPFRWSVTGGFVGLGGCAGAAVAINDVGQVALWWCCSCCVVRLHGTFSFSSAFLWDETGRMINLGVLLTGLNAFPNALNSSGSVVGWSQTHAIFGQHAFLWTQAKGMQDLGTLGGKHSLTSNALRINDSGAVIGVSQTGTLTTHAFLWTEAGGMQDLGTLGGATSTPSAINSSGDVVGVAQTASGDNHAFLWTQSGGMQDLGTLGGATSSAAAINRFGVVVGIAQTADRNNHAFLWTQLGGMKDLGTLPGFNTSVAVAINDSGEIVGDSYGN